MASSMKVYRRIQVISDSDTDEPSPNTSSDETSSSTYHSVVDDSSSARRPTSSVRSNQDYTHSIELENNEISINDSSLENTELSSDFKGQIIQCSPDNSCDKSCDSNEETESDCKLANHVNLMPNTPIKEVLDLSKNSVNGSKDRILETSCISSECLNLPKSPDLSENLGLFPDCDISPIKPSTQKGLTYLKTENDESFQFTSTQIGEGHNFTENSSVKDIQSISPAKMFDDQKTQLKGLDSSHKRSPMFKSGFNSQDFQSTSCKTNIKDKSLKSTLNYKLHFTSTLLRNFDMKVQNSSEDEVSPIDNSVTIFDDSKAFLKEDNNNGFKRSAMGKSGFNSPAFHSSSSKMNVKHKSIVPSSSDEEDCPTNNSVIIFDDSKELLKEEHNSDFNNSTIKKSAFNLQDLQASLSKIKVKPKDIGDTSSKLEFTNINDKKDIVNLVTPERLPQKEDPEILKSKIAMLEKEIFNAKCTLKTANIELLPDRGVRLQMMVNNKQKDLMILKEELNKLEKCSAQNNVPRISCKQSLHAEFNAQAISNATGVGGSGSLHRVITLDSLEQLHNSLKSRPQENVFSEAPKGLKTNVELMPHQKHALAWLMWREKQVPPGGILADDMGLGKTLTMISLVLKSEEEESASSEESEGGEKSKSWLCSRNSKFVKGGTLVICPASLLNQWEGEVAARCKSGILKVVVHHGSKRDATGNSLSRPDVVVTTYSIVRSECSKKGALFQVNWKRIILDEAHVVRNYKNQTSVAVCELKAKYRWALTGTPIHNKEVDLFALIKFLRCAPFDEYAAWRRWVDNKNASGLQRLNTIVNSLMLRRTKAQLQTLGTLQCLPAKEFHQINLKLNKEEFAVYQKVLNFSRTLVAQYLHQKLEKEQQLLGIPYVPDARKNRNMQDHAFLGNSDLAHLNKQINAVQDVKTFQILVLILRLRQICCHPGLIESMINKESCEADGLEDSNDIEDELQSKLKDLSLMDDNIEDTNIETKVLVKDNPVFNIHRKSSKMNVLFNCLTETLVDTEDKAIIVSQWTQMLNILHIHLCDMGMKCAVLSGSVPVKERMEIIQDFNNSSSKTQILLLSLTAGGVGLNLVGANHLFLFDIHWNPQLEAQAYDRVYRVGQKKTVHIYKFLCDETIEQRIQKLQDNKLALASTVLTGVRQQHSQKLSFNDIKMLFSM